MMQTTKFIKNGNKIFVYLYLLVLSVIICLMLPTNVFSRSCPSTDSSVFITIAREIISGKIPYKDLFDHKGPLLYFINTIGVLVGDEKGVWIVEVISLFVSVVFTYKTISIFRNRIISLLSVTSGYMLLTLCFSGGNLTEEYALPLVSIALFCIVLLIRKENGRSAMICACILGTTFGLSLMLRPNMFAVWFSFSLFVLLYCIKRGNYTSLARYIVFFVCGIVIALSPFFIYLYFNGALSDYIFQNFTFNFQYAGNGIGISGVIRNFIHSISALNGFIAVGIVINIISMCFHSEKKMAKMMNMVNLLSITVSVALISISSYIYDHYYIVIVPLAVISISYIYQVTFDLIASKGKDFFTSTALIVVLTLFVTINPLFNIYKSFRYYLSGDNMDEVTRVEEIINENAADNSTLQVLGNDCAIYLYNNLTIANRFIYDNPPAVVSEEVHNAFVDDWSVNMPDMLVFSRDYNASCYKDNIDNHRKWLGSVIDESYELIGETDKYMVFQKRMRCINGEAVCSGAGI